MALFKNRKGSDSPIAASPAESVEVLRRRARHRLIGAAVLVLVAVVGFPLVFDTQPRPVAVDIPIEIPDRNKVKPLPAPPAKASAAAAAAVAAAPPADTASTPETRMAPGAGLDAREEVVASKSEPKQAQVLVKPKQDAIKTEASKTPAAPKPAGDAKPAAAPAATAPAPAAANADRFVVQVGAFADNAKAQEARRKLEKAGLKTYAQVVDTKDGKRTRVRVGPFTQRADADKAASKIKGLDLPAAVLTL